MWAYWMFRALLFAYQRAEGVLHNYRSGLTAIGSVKARLVWQVLDMVRQLI